jgi:hypothetical protein
MKLARAVLLVLPLVAAACSSSSHVSTPTIQAARQFEVSGFEPADAVQPGKPTTVAFTIDQPSGQPLTRYRRGPGPHTGVHLIIVRRDLGEIIHHHPPISPDGHISDSVVFPAPGPYRVLIDVYPAGIPQQPNFQLFENVDVSGTYKPQPLPPFAPTVDVGGYKVQMQRTPNLKAVHAAFLPITVTDANGRPATFTPWFGAIAHAIFFRKGSLSYFHTHICGPNTPACAGIFGNTRISGHSTAPGRLSVGVLLPQAGTWRLFLQFKVDGKILTAPFTLHVQ